MLRKKFLYKRIIVVHKNRKVIITFLVLKIVILVSQITNFSKMNFFICANLNLPHAYRARRKIFGILAKQSRKRKKIIAAAFHRFTCGVTYCCGNNFIIRS